jgi:hypothetical protein
VQIHCAASPVCIHPYLPSSEQLWLPGSSLANLAGLLEVQVMMQCRLLGRAVAARANPDLSMQVGRSNHLSAKSRPQNALSIPGMPDGPVKSSGQWSFWLRTQKIQGTSQVCR